MIRKTLQTFLRQAKDIHNDEYDYSEVKYITCKDNIKIICRVHGAFNQTPSSHLNGSGCRLCADKRTAVKSTGTIDNFILKANIIHNNKYDYFKSIYINSKTKLIIICAEHGEFSQQPEKHILEEQGCPKCGGRYKKNTEIFINEAILIHGDKYDYSKCNYVN